MVKSLWLIPLIFIWPYEYADSVTSLSYSQHNYSCPYEESLALLQFKQTFSINSSSAASDYCDSVGQTSEPKMKYWKRGTDCCTWAGITCDWGTGHVIGMDLSCSQLQGIIPSNSTLFTLSQLRKLDLAFNDLHQSRISHEFGQFATSLTHLNLSFSLFTGKVSSKISHLNKLVSLDLSYNPDLEIESQDFKLLIQNTTQLGELSLFGVNIPSVLPMNFSYSLTFLDLSQTGLHGTLSKLSFLGQLTYLDISSNILSGEIPSTLSNLGQLTYLDISWNNLSGEIPSSLSNLKHLTFLNFGFNHLGGQIPNVFANFTALISIDFQNNKFIGPFPSSIANLAQLVELNLRMNSLTGPLPSTILGLHNLIYLELQNNSFNGILPSGLFFLPSLEYLNLAYNRFTGEIHEFKSTSLSRIRLNNNDLHGPIPNWFSKLVNLSHLNLSWNNFSGTVELDMLSNLTKLDFLDLSHNSLSVSTNINATFPNIHQLGLASCKIKEFPYFLKDSPSLGVLDLSYNQIHSQLPLNWPLPYTLGSLQLQFNLLQGPLPWSICNFSSLFLLDLSNNRFDGTIPQCLGNFSLDLIVLDLRMNRFYGTIPTTFGAKGNQLRSLNLHGNQLQGMLPRSLANCTSLKLLDLGNNQINDSFPHWLGTLPELQVLFLRYNRFHGPISSTSKTELLFTKLRIIDLSHNQFTGFLPSTYIGNFKAMMNLRERDAYGKYTTNWATFPYYDEITMVTKGMDTDLNRILIAFIAIDLSSNKFEGEIPNVIGKLISLRLLNLSHNCLTGHIPSVLENLSVLETLDLSSNQLVGGIPQQLTGLTFLAVLNLSQNHLVGPIPEGKQFNTFQNDSYDENSGLCGFPLSKKCRDGATQQPPIVQQEEDSGFLSGFTWKVVLMGYG